MTDISCIDVHTLLPQADPYVLIDCLTHIDENEAVSLFKVNEDNVFVERGKFQAAGMIENIAQTCAAHIGYYSGDGKRIGLVGAVQSMQVMKLPRVDSILETSITFTARAFSLSSVDAEIRVAGELVAKGCLKLKVETENLTQNKY